MSKKELNAWDRFWLYVKQNEKIIWVLLLLLLAPTFAFTGAFSSFMTSQRNVKVASLYGRPVTRNQFTEAQRKIQLIRDIRRFSSFSTEYQGVLEFLLYRMEADRLGLRVSDLELGAEIRKIYRNMLARDEGEKAIANLRLTQAGKNISDSSLQSVFWSAYRNKFEELEENDVFGEEEQRDWNRRIKEWRGTRTSIDRKYFEESLQEVMTAEKVEEYVRSSVQVTPEEVLEEYRREEQSRKFSFFEVEASGSKEEIEKSVTDEEIEKRFENRREDFRQSLKLQIEYLSVPVSAFEERVTLTEEDLRKEYDRVKGQKYRTFVEGTLMEGFVLLTPEEKEAREKKAYLPFEDVKEEVRLELKERGMREEARKVAEEIRKKLFPDKKGTIGKKDEKKDQPTPATYDEILKEYPMVKTGLTPWIDRNHSEEELPPEAASRQIRQFFSGIDPRTPERKLEIKAPDRYTASPDIEPEYYVFYKQPQIRPAGVPEKLDEIREEVREKVVQEKLFERARERAQALVKTIEESKKSFEEAAQEAGSEVITTGFLDRYGTIKVPMTPEEIQEAEKEGTLKEEDPREKPHESSRAILEFGFKALREKGKVDGFAEDPDNSSCIVVRWDDTIYPDASEFDEKRSRYEQQLLRERQTEYLTDWRKKLWDRAQPAWAIWGEE